MTIKRVGIVNAVWIAGILLAGCGRGLGSSECGPATVSPPPVANSSVTPPVTAAAGDSWQSPADGMLLTYVPAGDFLIGASEDDLHAAQDERPQHKVRLNAFWIDTTEVPNSMYALCVQAGACTPPAEDSSFSRGAYFSEASCGTYPVVEVSWHQAADYCQWAGRRMPTEAEWEAAGRGPDARVFPWGDELPSNAMANLCGTECLRIEPRDPGIDDGYLDTAPVGSFAGDRSVFGVLDMAGNVAEWVADRGKADYYSTSPSGNPTGPLEGDTRVFRGGAFVMIGSAARLTARGYLLPTATGNFIGFRCAVSAGP